VALFHPSELSADSFLINHSNAFYVAWGISWAEYFIEHYFFPSIKGTYILMIVGFLVALAGQCLRTLAMYTAASNFHHLVREEKEKEHKLVTFGIYSYLRHPAYFGWFWWAVATQVLLGNPISTGLWAFASWKFFSERIQGEERALIKIFGQDYVNYRSRTPVGIPFIQ